VFFVGFKGHNGNFPCRHCWVYKFDVFEIGIYSKNPYPNCRHRDFRNMDEMLKALLDYNDVHKNLNIKSMLTAIGMNEKVRREKIEYNKY